jgi:hypothetical protein
MPCYMQLYSHWRLSSSKLNPNSLRAASEKGKEAGREDGLQIARELLLEVRGAIQGVQVSAPFNNVRYALDVFEALPEFGAQNKTDEVITAAGN